MTDDTDAPAKKRRTKDRRRTFGELLERARGGEWLKLGVSSPNARRFRDDRAVFAFLEGVHEKWKTGLPLDADDIDTLMYLVLEKLELPVASGRTPNETTKAKQAAELSWGRRRIKQLKATGDYDDAKGAVQKTERELKSRSQLFDTWNSKTLQDRLRRRHFRSE